MTVRTITLTAAAALLATAAAAQDQPQDAAVNYVEMRDSETVARFELTVDELDDLDVYGAGGELVGEIEEVLADQNGEAVAFAVETSDLLNDYEVVVPFDALQLVGERFVTALSQEEIEDMPRWDD